MKLRANKRPQRLGLTQAEEDRSKLQAILVGPWEREGKLIRKLLPLNRPAKSLADKAETIDLTTELRGRANRKLEKRLKKLLRPHWKSKKGFGEQDSEYRDSFDEALTSLQLLELAIATGFIEGSAIRASARQLLVERLASKAARGFVEAYDYLTVASLAQRMNVNLGIPAVRPKRPEARASLYFSVFLDRFAGWYDQPDLNAFLGTLDGYGLRAERYFEPDAIHELMAEGELEEGVEVIDLQRYLASIRGYVSFIFALRSILNGIPLQAQPPYARFFSYWLTKFFGYDLGRKGHTRDETNLWDWSKGIDRELLAWCILGCRDVTPLEQRQFNADFSEALKFTRRMRQQVRR